MKRTLLILAFVVALPMAYYASGLAKAYAQGSIINEVADMMREDPLDVISRMSNTIRDELQDEMDAGRIALGLPRINIKRTLMRGIRRDRYPGIDREGRFLKGLDYYRSVYGPARVRLEVRETTNSLAPQYLIVVDGLEE